MNNRTSFRGETNGPGQDGDRIDAFTTVTCRNTQRRIIAHADAPPKRLALVYTSDLCSVKSHAHFWLSGTVVCIVLTIVNIIV